MTETILKVIEQVQVLSRAVLALLGLFALLLAGCGGQPGEDLEDVPSQLPIPNAPKIESHTSPYYSNDPSITISGSCDSGTRITLTSDSFSFETSCQNSTYSFTFNANSDGEYNYTVEAINQYDQSASDSLVWVLDRTAPGAIGITTPASSPHVTSGDSITFVGSCEDDATVIINDVSASNESEIPCSNGSFNFTSAQKTVDGDYDFEFSQRDLSGNTSATNTRRWTRTTVTPVNIASLTMPVNGSYGASGEIEFQIEWQEVVNVSGTPQIEIDVGGVTRYAQYVSGSGTETLVFQYVVMAGDNDGDGIQAQTDIDLNGGSITGVSTNPGALDIAAFLGALNQVLVNTGIAPPAQVTNVQAAPTVDNTKLAISWNVPADNGTAITNYVVQYRVKGTQNWSTRSPNPTANSTELAGLVANTTYEIRVAANNGALGPYSSVQEAEIFDIMGFSPIAWLDATDIQGDGSMLGDGSLVSTWVDKTAAAQSATEADPAKQPVYTWNAQNGLPAVRFDNLDRGLQGTFTRNNGTNLTIIIVGQYDAAYSDKCMFEFIGPGSARAFFIDRRYAANTYYSPALTKDEFHMWTITNAGNFATVVEDGATTIYNGTTHFNTDFTGTGNYYLGDDSTGGNRMYGFIGEILIFDSDLAPADIVKIEDYLKAKWGL